jgi:hypothetical protein
MKDAAEFLIAPELYTRDGRIITSLADAIALLREHETRPGVDDRDEVLHRLERAKSESELQAAADAFVTWAEELDLLLAPPEAARPEHEPLPRK